MADISKIDKNLKVESGIDKPDIDFFSGEDERFKLYGVFKENGMYRRMPEAVAKSVSDGVYGLHTNTAGGRVRFYTDSAYIVVSAVMSEVCKMPHMAFTGAIGFDVYVGDRYVKSIIPPADVEDKFEGVVEFETDEFRDITINFPLYSNVKDVYIGLQKCAEVKEPSKYSNDKPIVYYGSSITQGGCASRPGTCYQGIISRRFNRDYINLGFSGSARAEDEMIEYIKNLDMSMFVYDYDHNAPNVEHLKATHEKMFKAVRERHPEIPIIIMSRPKYYLTDDEQKRLEVIKQTYNNAVSGGDKAVYLLNGSELTVLCLNEGTVDDCHPTDFGFASMAKALGDLIEKEGL